MGLGSLSSQTKAAIAFQIRARNRPAFQLPAKLLKLETQQLHHEVPMVSAMVAAQEPVTFFARDGTELNRGECVRPHIHVWP